MLRYRHGMDSTATFPEIARAVSALPVRRVRPRRRGRRARRERAPALRSSPEAGPPPAARRHRARRGRAVRRRYFAFDLLGFEDFDLRGLPLETRKALLQRFVPAHGPRALRRPRRGEGRRSCSRRPAGSASRASSARRRTRPYRGARSADWLKVKLDRTGDFVVVGYTKPEGGAVGVRRAAPRYWQDADGGGARSTAGASAPASPTSSSTRSTRVSRRASARHRAFGGAVPTGEGHVWVEPELVVRGALQGVDRRRAPAPPGLPPPARRQADRGMRPRGRSGQRRRAGDAAASPARPLRAGGEGRSVLEPRRRSSGRTRATPRAT